MFNLKIYFTFDVFKVFKICRESKVFEADFVFFPSSFVSDFEELFDRVLSF